MELKNLKLADKIRVYTILRYAKPARKEGKHSFQIRAGDLHKAMGLVDRLPAVCSALGTNKFLELGELELLDRTGPNVSTTTTFHYKIL